MVAFVGIIVGAMRVILALVRVVISFNKLADSVMPAWLDQCELEFELSSLQSMPRFVYLMRRLL